MEYKRKKKNDIKQWLLGGNAKIYGLILIVFLAAVLFMFKTVNSMFQPQTQDTANQEEVTEDNNNSFVIENQSYLLKVNKSNNFITVYKIGQEGEFDQPYKTFRCSVNSNVETGDTQITDKNIWRKLSDGSYGHYASKLENSGVIASVPYYAQDSSKLNSAAYNNLGKTASIGYIYLASIDAQWIYENCGNKTTVSVYEDDQEQPVIALDDFVKISPGFTYDPTDQSNPVNNNISDVKIAFMRGVYDCSVELNGTFDKWENIYAQDVNGNEITSKITIDGSVDVSVPGTYTLIYYLSDNFGTNLAYYRYVTVEDNTSNTNSNTSNSEPPTEPETSPSTSTVPQTTTSGNSTQEPSSSGDKSNTEAHNSNDNIQR